MSYYTPQIVDIDGLADSLICSKETVLKSWRQLPHFFVGTGNTAKGARFDVNDVVDFLKNRDYYANLGQKDKELRGKGTHQRTSPSYPGRIPNKRGGKAMGAEHKTLPQRKPAYASCGDPFDLLRGIK